MIKKIAYLLLFLVLPLTAAAQIEIEESDDGAPPRNGYRQQLVLDICAPHIFSNGANARAFDGIISTGLVYNIRVFKGLSVGAYARYTGFNIYSPKMGQSNPLTTTITFGMNLQYEVKLSDRFCYIPSVMAGAGFINYQNLIIPPKGAEDSPRTNLQDWGASVQLNNGFYYYVKRNQRIAIGIVLGINYFSHEFNLRDTGLEGDGALNTFSDSGPTINFNFGFGIMTKMGKIN